MAQHQEISKPLKPKSTKVYYLETAARHREQAAHAREQANKSVSLIYPPSYWRHAAESHMAEALAYEKLAKDLSSTAVRS